uniref:Homeobox domain-containing protein n=1 Tax=Mycena chlorophos TaxID=658473 RepID=A0ABQ0MDT9_MYCCL|nr:predicted protein [Mycena chlorophos]
MSASETHLLESLFDAGVRYPDTKLRARLGVLIDRTPRSIQIWFQNRRQRLRQEDIASACMAALSMADYGIVSADLISQWSQERCTLLPKE